MTAVRALTVGPSAVTGNGSGATWNANAANGHARGEGSHGATSFEVGAPADLVVVDTAERWQVTPESLLSKGKNTPLIGRSLPGRVLLTVANGRIAYADANPA
jgi:dihydroorotase-like cyclic amidohydrolase